MISKKIVTASLFLLAVFGNIFTGCQSEEPLEGASVVLVLIDTLRSDRLGVNGYSPSITPCLDRLAEEGVYFPRALAPSSWTKPSVASLLTGLYPGHHGVLGDLSIYRNLAFFETSFVTLAERMQAAGYQTAAFVTNANLISFYHFDQGFDSFTQPAGDARALMDKAKAWIETYRSKGKFFLYLHIIDPHAPYFPPEDFRGRYVQGDPGPKAPFTKLGRYEDISAWIEQYLNWQPTSPEDPFRFDFQPEKLGVKLKEIAPNMTLDRLRNQIYLDFNGREDPALQARIKHLISLYDGEVAYTDDALQDFVSYLDRMALLNQTVLVVTSDHGEAFLEHDTWGHRRFVHGEEIDVPLILRIPGPGGSPLNGSFNHPVSLVDLYPTLMDMLGLEVPASLSGVSLWPFIRSRGGTPLPVRPVFTESFLGSGDHVSVVAEGQKLIRSAAPQREVKWMYYDLERDPGERNPMAPEEAGEKGRSLKQAINKLLHSRTVDFDKKGEMGTPSQEEIKQLRELGYL